MSLRPFFGATLPGRIRSILASRGLTLAQISRSSHSLSPDNRLHHIPHNFYSAFQNRKFSPSIFQVWALSVLSGYRLVDWLAVFGFALDDVPRLQASLPAMRTVELDANVYRTPVSIPWFHDLKEPDLSASLVPLSQWLAPSAPRILDSVSLGGNSPYRYLKIGSEDAFAFPELLPGSIVRVESRFNPVQQITVGDPPARNLYLVEHGGGLICSRLYRPDSTKVVLCSRHLPYAPVELEEDAETFVTGMVDVEIRPLLGVEKPVVPPRFAHFWRPVSLTQPSQTTHVGEFLRHARMRSGFSFREASERTKLIARRLGDARYYCAAGSLSDYETQILPPRHIHKLISICAAYFASATRILEASGVSLDNAGELPMPAEFLELPPAGPRAAAKSSHFLGEMEQHFKYLPYFLHSALPSLFELPDISIRDVFWVGGSKGFVHPYLVGALFLVVDRKQKIPRPSLSRPKWEQPVFVLQQRDGSHLCGFCNLQNGVLLLRSCLAGVPKLLQLRHRVDAEIVGRVVGIVRRLE